MNQKISEGIKSAF